MRTLRIAIAILLGLALPIAAFAQTTSSSSQLSTLLSELSQLQQQIVSISGSSQTSTAASSPTVSTSASTPGTNSCPDLTETLSIGSSGAQVVGLQTFLAQQGFFSASATGYFGSITAAAVGQWQEQNGVVAGGDANSTGLGVVGPKTRAAMNAMCGTPIQAQCLDIKPPTADCSSGWQPVLDAAGCAMYYQCVVQLPSTPSTPSVTQTTTTASATTTTSTACPVVMKPQCSGTVVPFQTNANGCVISYECTL